MVDFLVIGPGNITGYKNMFPLIRDNRIWFGVGKRGMEFNGGGVINSCWITSIDHNKRPSKIILLRKYVESEYSRFDERPDIINIDKTNDIPSDYDGIMAVPITFIDKWNYEQFDILGYAHSAGNINDWFVPLVDGKQKFARLLIKRK